MNPDTVFQLLVDADPAGSPEALAPVLERLSPTPVHESTGSTTMQLTAERPTTTTQPPPPRGRWFLAAAAAAIAVAAAAIILFARDEPDPIEPASVPVTQLPATPEERAIRTARTYLDALVGGDVETVLDLSDPTAPNPEGDRHIAEMYAVEARLGTPPTVGNCTARDAVAWIEVRCDYVSHDPVWVELGVHELVWPSRVNDDGTVRWLPFEGADFGQANHAYVEYLRRFEPDGYDRVCSPATYELGTTYSDQGLALTAPCAELRAPLAADIAAWVRAGRPDS